MAKSKKSGDNKPYSFTVDVEDPKYAKLVSFLEGIDSGARSFIIRQILNSYVNSQNNEGISLFGLNSTPSQIAPVEEKRESSENENPEEPLKPVEPPEFEKKPQRPKPKLPPQLNGLKNTFN